MTDEKYFIINEEWAFCGKHTRTKYQYKKYPNGCFHCFEEDMKRVDEEGKKGEL